MTFLKPDRKMKWGFLCKSLFLILVVPLLICASGTHMAQINSAPHENMAAMHKLLVLKTQGGSIILPGEGCFEFESGALVKLIAVPDDNYEFAYWTGDVKDPYSPTINLTLNSDKNIKACFVPQKSIQEDAIPIIQDSLADRHDIQLKTDDSFAYQDDAISDADMLASAFNE